MLRQAQALAAEQALAALRAANARAEKRRQLSQAYREELQRLAGEKAWTAYRALRQRYADGVRALHATPAVTRADLEKRAARQAVLRAEMPPVGELGIDKTAVQAVQARYGALHGQGGGLFVPGRGGAPPVSGCQADLRQVFMPPYDGWQWSFSWSRSGGLPDPVFQRYLDHEVGEVGSQTAVSGIGVDFDDDAEITYRTAVRQWFTMPATGQICVSIRYEHITRENQGSTAPEVGIPAVTVTQQASFFARATAPETTNRVMLGGPLLYYAEDTVKTHWNHVFLATGTVAETAARTVPGVFTEGTAVLVNVGLETLNQFWTNQCSVTSSLRQRYLIREIRLAVTG